MFRVIDGERPPKPSCDPPISEALWQYMTEYWTENSAMRPAAGVIVQHMGLNYVSWLVTQFSLSPSASGSADQEEMEMRSSIQRRMTQALEIAREAVILDTTNEDPAATVQKYRASVALLSQLLFQMHSEGETVSSPRGQRNRVREEEIRRIQNIANRMNVLSIIYNIPVMTEDEYSAMQAENQEDIPRVF
ncbi:hypothetical protein C8J57DRAFT_1323538 [Mycena rebaudengoi]|nr:hypothetical protein C8J57DRAFT_1323538 [Mycena rebaudengoi]